MSTTELVEGNPPGAKPVRNLLADLNLRQLEAVAAPPGPLLVLAGPGSGKTRILTYRAAWLVEHEGALPKEVLCVTFTNRAAEEMRVRLEGLLGDRGRDLRIHTFHALCARILRQYASEIGLDPHFVVADEEHQIEILTGIMRQADLSLEQFPPYRVIDFISEFKRGLKDPAHASPDEWVPPEFVTVAETYGAALRERNLLDFDDLIGYAVRLLAKNRVVRAAVQQQIPHVLVDEYQDIDAAQFELLRLIAPKGSDVLAVADDAQSIYGWRGAQPELIDAYIGFYRPRIVELEESYRSTANILYAAQNMLRKGDRGREGGMRRRKFLKTDQGPGSPIHHYIFATGRQEQSWVARLIRRLVEGGEHEYGDIAVLYRTHQLADEIEGALHEAGIPVQRVRKDSFFSEPLPHEVVRYLHLVHSLTGDNLLAAFNFPQTLADELTVLQLQTLANIHRLPLSEVARRSDSFPELSPLTRANLAEFMRLFEEELVPRAERGAAEAVTALFEVLGRRRSPFTTDEFRTLRDAGAFFRFADAADALRDHLAAHGSARLVAPATADAACAAVILRETVERYLGATLEVALSPAGPGTPEDEGEAAPALEFVLGERRVVVRPPTGGSLGYSLSETAWRLAQDLLIAHETLAAAPIVIYDLETTGTDVKRDEIVEIGAQRWEGGEPSGPPFYTLVRPAQGIPREATLIHGIRAEDVRDAEPVAVALPKFLRYVGGHTVAGHNIIRFDNRIMDRETGRLLRRGFPNPAVDTLDMAKRLYQEGSATPESYSLEALLRKHGLGEKVAHRAAGDVAQIGALYGHLLKENSLQLALRSLPEYLPLAAAGMAAAGVERRDENAAIWNGARRMAERLGGIPGLEAARTLLADALSPSGGLTAALSREGPGEADGLASGASSEGQGEPDTVTPACPERGEAAVLEAGAAALSEGEPLPEDETWATLRERFMAQVATFDRFTNDRSLRAFLDYQALVTSLDTTRLNRSGRVTLMTLHNAKGTEYPVVIIVGLEEDNLPLWTAREDPRRLAEERRVFYVGLTRAQKRLYLTSVRQRGESGLRMPSRFAFELPPRYVRRLVIGPRGDVKQLRG